MLNNSDVRKKLRDLAIETSENSHSPYSNVKVGSAILTTSGEVFSGCNIENSSFGGTVCAERVAIFKAVSEGHNKIQELYVYTDAGWPPCGICRQVISEFASPETKIIIGDKDGNENSMPFKDLLPLAFTPDKLGK